MLAKLAPLPRRPEHGAQYLEGAVGRAGPGRSRRIEPGRDPRMVDGVEPHFPEGGHRPVLHVDVEGLERGRLPAALAALAVAGGEVAEQRRLGLARGRHRVAAPDAGEHRRGLLAGLAETGLREAPQRELAHPSPDPGLDDEGPDAGGQHPHPEMRQRAVPERVFGRLRLRGGDGRCLCAAPRSCLASRPRLAAVPETCAGSARPHPEQGTRLPWAGLLGGRR